MKRLFLPHLAFVSVIALLAACQAPQPQPPAHGNKHPGFNPPPMHDSGDATEDHPKHPDADGGSGDATPKPEQHPDGAGAETTPPAAAQPKMGNFEYGKAVPGKPGFVTSPYAPYQGYVDVRGYPPGTEVKDPYTGKTFLVP